MAVPGCCCCYHRSVAAAQAFPAAPLVLSACMYGPASSPRLLRLGAEWAGWMFKHAPAHQLRAMAGPLLQRLLAALGLEGAVAGDAMQVRCVGSVGELVFGFGCVGFWHKTITPSGCAAACMLQRLLAALGLEGAEGGDAMQVGRVDCLGGPVFGCMHGCGWGSSHQVGGLGGCSSGCWRRWGWRGLRGAMLMQVRWLGCGCG